MADNEYLEQFRVTSYRDLETIFFELQEELVKLKKRLLVVLDKVVAGMSRRMKKMASDTQKLLNDAYWTAPLEDQAYAAALYGEVLAGALYALRLEFARLQTAVIRAAAPIAQVLLPVVSAAVEALTGLANAVGFVLRQLILGSGEAEAFSSAVTGATGAVKGYERTLAGFDQINRLGKQSASSGGIFSVPELKPVTGQWKKLAEQILAILQPLREIDLSPATEALNRLYTAMRPITRALFEGLEWAWNNLFVPMAQWTAEHLLPMFLDTLSAALQALDRIIQELKPAFTWLWENCLQPLAQWAGGRVIEYLQGIIDKLTGVSGWMSDNQGPVDRIIQSGKTWMLTLGQLLMKTSSWSEVTDGASSAISRLLLSIGGMGLPMGEAVTTVGSLIDTVMGLAQSFGLVDAASGSTWDSIKSVWEGAWSWLKAQTVDPAFAGVKDGINGIIALINGLLQGVTNGLNYLCKSMNSIGFQLPDWIPVLGGKSFSFNLQKFTAPQIPYLARGAVLPANKPFMAVVGDQRHGTNIEAPLATIQEAVAVVMEDMIASNMAGHEATVAVLRDILQAVLGISIGDDTIAAAVERHNRKMAMIWGG